MPDDFYGSDEPFVVPAWQTMMRTSLISVVIVHSLRRRHPSLRRTPHSHVQGWLARRKVSVSTSARLPMPGMLLPRVESCRRNNPARLLQSPRSGESISRAYTSVGDSPQFSSESAS